MNILEEIRSKKRKPKELVVFLAEEVKKEPKLMDQVEDGLKIGSKVEKGVCAEAMEYISKEKPEIVAPYLNIVMDFINFDAPRVKWETARVVANLAAKYPEEVALSVPKLLANTKDKGTVVRWSAAFALTEFAKHNSQWQNELIPKFQKIIKTETNNGVKNVYLKALKELQK